MTGEHCLTVKLTRRLHCASLPPRRTDVFRWFLGLAQGMAYLHAQSPAIVHRDLKPENILFSSKDLKTADAKIADFGLSKGIKSRAERDKEGSVSGWRGRRREDIAGRVWQRAAVLAAPGKLDPFLNAAKGRTVWRVHLQPQRQEPLAQVRAVPAAPHENPGDEPCPPCFARSSHDQPSCLTCRRAVLHPQTSKFSFTAVDATGNTGSKMYM